MDRNTIIEKLSRLRFCIFEPGNWEDIGFTERQIWINSEGYGYIACDEPCHFVELKNITNDLLTSIKRRISNNDLSLEDIRGTTFEDMLYDEFDQDEFDYLKPSLLSLPDNCNSNGSLFCGETIEGWLFFNTEEELVSYFEKKHTSYYYGKKWKDMDDDLLSCWYERVLEEESIKEDHFLPLKLDIFNDN